MSVIDTLNKFKYNKAGVDIGRSVFKLPHEHKTTINSGDLVPIGLFEVLPGDSWKININSVIRSLTPIAPTMDNSFVDIFAFYVPNRIACKDEKTWARIMGENTNGFWAPTEEMTLLNSNETFSLRSIANIMPGSAMNYYGLPCNMDIDETQTGSFPDIRISALPFNGYLKIWNEWFRDENLQAPLDLNNFFYSGTYLNLNERCLKVNKFHDLFTSCLPSPQKGESVFLPLGSSAPVSASGSGNTILEYVSPSGSSIPISKDLATDSAGRLMAKDGGLVEFTNLYADLTNATASTINALRQAFAIQRMLEKDARGGTRYREILKTHYGVSMPDSTVQVPQYLGGHRIPLNITQVLQTSSTDSVSPLGATGAFSNTALSEFLFDKSFTEHGYIHVLACIRPVQSYSQGLAKHWTRNRRFDWYFPGFANLGEQPVYTRELNVFGLDDNERVFGYNEAWAEYRYLPNLTTGYFAPNAGDSTLTAWTYTNNFDSLPVLNNDFITQSSVNVGQTLALTDSLYQYLADFYFDITATRPMPLYSIPGLIDHH